MPTDADGFLLKIDIKHFLKNKDLAKKVKIIIITGSETGSCDLY